MVTEVSEFNNIQGMKRKKMFNYCKNYDTFKRLLIYDTFANCHIFYDYFKNNLIKYRGNARECIV